MFEHDRKFSYIFWDYWTVEIILQNVQLVKLRKTRRNISTTQQDTTLGPWAMNWYWNFSVLFHANFRDCAARTSHLGYFTTIIVWHLLHSVLQIILRCVLICWYVLVVFPTNAFLDNRIMNFFWKEGDLAQKKSVCATLIFKDQQVWPCRQPIQNVPWCGLSLNMHA